MSMFEFSEKAKANIKCYKFSDDSVYYGEIAFTDNLNNIVSNFENLNVESRKALKCVRHGEGVQINGVNELNFSSKYEGMWDKDKKHGRGTCYYSDKSIYEGLFANDLFEGPAGKFTWADASTYFGEWKNGKMEGEGTFTHSDGHTLKGRFKNNYYFDGERWINPFLTQINLDIFKVKNLEFVKATKAENEKFNRNNILKASNSTELMSQIEDTIKLNKTPIIVRSKRNLISKEEIYKMLTREYREVDLRRYYLRLREKSYTTDVTDDLSKIILESIVKGLTLVLNFDDCSIKYEELFDPDIKEFYSKNLFTPEMWTPQLFSKKECWQSHVKNRPDIKLDHNFKFAVYSKFVLDSDLPEHDLINVIEKRFEKSLPLKSLNVIIVSK